jgi:multiple sugar transport system permease protein
MDTHEKTATSSTTPVFDDAAADTTAEAPPRKPGFRRAGLSPPHRAGRPGYRRKILVWTVGPAVVCELIVYALPIIAGIYTSFLLVNFTTLRRWLHAPWEGIANYRLILTVSAIADPLLRSFVLSLIYVATVVGVSLILAISAVVFVRTLSRSARFLQVIYLVPFVIPAYAGVLTWDFVFQGNGAATQLLSSDLHMLARSTLWLDGTNAFASMVIASIWRTWPFAFLMLLAASQQIPGELYEALRIDGGGRVQEVRFVIVPYLKNTAVILSLILFLWLFNDFTTPYVFFGQIPPADADLFPLHVYTSTFVNADYSLGSAMTLVAVIVLLAVAVPYSKLSGVLGRGQYA